MASKNLVYKINGVPTKEQIEKFDNDERVFYRFQEPHQKLTSRSCSWGMIFQSKAEALRDCEEWGYTKEEAILPGKSCMDTFEGILDFADKFDDNYVLLVFEGNDARVSGHDGEYVATYYKKVAVWSMQDVINYAKENIW